MANLIILASGVVICSGILSLVEASLFSYSLTKARLSANKGNRLARAALEIREKPFKAIAAFVILSAVVNIGGSIAVGSYASEQFSSRGIGIFSGILTFITIIFSEIIPKNAGERWSQIIFPIAAVPLRWLTFILSPIIWVIEFIANPFTSGVSPFTTSEEEISLLTDVGMKEGTIEPGEAELIERVFRLNDVTARDMMTPKPFVTFIDGNKTLRQVIDTVKNYKHSRIPVFEGDTNHIIGFAHQRDLLKAVTDGDLDKTIKMYVHKPMIVPETRLGDDLLRDFQENRSHLAVVVSEYGNVVGVVGLEDVLEELVGEIIDEKDVAPKLIKRVAKNEIIAHGQTRITSINHFFNTALKSRKNLNGYLLEKIGKIPDKDEIIEINELVFHMEEVGSNQIDRVRIIKNRLEVDKL